MLILVLLAPFMPSGNCCRAQFRPVQFSPLDVVYLCHYSNLINTQAVISYSQPVSLQSRHDFEFRLMALIMIIT